MAHTDTLSLEVLADIADESADVASHADWLNPTGAATLAPEAVKRTVWVDLTSALLESARRQAWRHLPYAEAEDMLADLLTRELEAATLAGRPGCVRTEHLTPTWLRLTALDWRTGTLARRHAELGADESDLSLTLAADESAEPTDRPQSPEAIYRLAADVARALHLPAELPVIANLAGGLSDLTGADLAAGWGIGLSTWQKASAAGGKEIAASYPDASDLAARLAAMIGPDLAAWRRLTPLAARKLGADIPETGRHRTSGQLAREADWLIARPAAARMVKASRASHADSRDGCLPHVTPTQPDCWRIAHTLTPSEVRTRLCFAALLAAQAPTMADSGPVAGNRPHRAHTYPLVAAPVSGAAPAKPLHGWGHAYPTGASADLGWRSDLASREVSTDRPTLADRAPTDCRNGQPPSAPMPTYRQTPASVKAPSEAPSEAPSLYRPAAGYTSTHSYRTWRLAFMAPAKRRGALCPRSLDTKTAGELAREDSEPFRMTADMAPNA